MSFKGCGEKVLHTNDITDSKRKPFLGRFKCKWVIGSISPSSRASAQCVFYTHTFQLCVSLTSSRLHTVQENISEFFYFFFFLSLFFLHSQPVNFCSPNMSVWSVLHLGNTLTSALSHLFRRVLPFVWGGGAFKYAFQMQILVQKVIKSFYKPLFLSALIGWMALPAGWYFIGWLQSLNGQ